jgi:hypothetical protein
MLVIQTAIQIYNTVLFQDYFYQETGIFTCLDGEMRNDYRR